MEDGKILQLRLDQIRLDGDTQMRVELSSKKASEYAEKYRKKVLMPNPDVFFDGSHYWMADGFTRWHGMNQAGIKYASFRVFTGTKRDAFLYAVGTNDEHGLGRTDEDVRYCVRRLLQDEEWGKKWSDRDIAARCKCSHHIVGDERRKLKEEKTRKQAREESSLGAAPSEDEEPDDTRRTYTTKHGTTATMNTEKIGKTAPRERTVYPINARAEPGTYAGKLKQLARSRKKHARQSLEVCESEDDAVARFLEVRRSIPVEN